MNNINKIPIEKERRIVKAGFEVFGENEYKKANTEDIAVKAGISKGLLFYYFKNKKEIYNYIFEYGFKYLVEYIADEKYREIEDFFELLEYASEKKIKILTEHPYLFKFYLKAMFEPEDILINKNKIYNLYRDSFDYLSNIDRSKFKDNVDIKEIYNMLIYLSEGYTNIKLRNNEEIILEEFLDTFNSWKKIIKPSVYKEG